MRDAAIIDVVAASSEDGLADDYPTFEQALARIRAAVPQGADVAEAISDDEIEARLAEASEVAERFVQAGDAFDADDSAKALKLLGTVAEGVGVPAGPISGADTYAEALERLFSHWAAVESLMSGDLELRNFDSLLLDLKGKVQGGVGTNSPERSGLRPHDRVAAPVVRQAWARFRRDSALLGCRWQRRRTQFRPAARRSRSSSTRRRARQVGRRPNGSRGSPGRLDDPDLADPAFSAGRLHTDPRPAVLA